MTSTTLALSGPTHARLHRHLFPGDDLEAAAILLCSRTPGPRTRLLVREVLLIPYAACSRRTRVAITWPGRYLEDAIDHGESESLSLILLHSHPSGNLDFSDTDDASDLDTITSLFQAYGDLHGSAIMAPTGAIRARLYGPNLVPRPVDLVTCAADNINFWWNNSSSSPETPHTRPIAFTSGMTAELNRLTAIVVGVSGTGSIQAEQASRIGFGGVTLIDFDRTKRRNLNRIINATQADAAAQRLKVDVVARAITAHRGLGVAKPIPASLNTREAILAASQGDVLFCCVDTLEGRYLVDLLASAFLLPLFDVGVAIPVRESGTGIAIADAVGRIDYVQPGGPSLADRRVYTPDTLRAEYLRFAAPDAHAQELEDGYIQGTFEQAPAVITLNMRAASACMNEFLIRAYPFRLDPNRNYARTMFSLAACDEDHYSEDEFTISPNPLLGRGAKEPLLGLPSLGTTSVEYAA